MTKAWLLFLLVLTSSLEAAHTLRITGREKPISPDLFGIFFEDINYAADGGLYAELVQNRSFEYQATEQPAWNQLTAWELVKRGAAKGDWLLEDTDPICPNNPHYVILKVGTPGDGVGIMNSGFDGIPIQAGETYEVSFFARQLYMNAGWGAAIPIEGTPMPVTITLESRNGVTLGRAAVSVSGWNWRRARATITADRADPHARLVVLATAVGGIAIDDVSLMPARTFRGRRNGLRADLAQAIADLHPRFVRFPGGCVAHGRGLANIYRWKDTIGPVERRRQQKNFWSYHQTVGLGYFEYFQFCEDIGAKPLPVLAAGVSCQNADQRRGHGQQSIPLADMPAYIQDILDLIEWANGPADSTWGAQRAAAGHPAPFHLEYLGIGNEDAITPEFKERFRAIQDAIRAKHPEITIIGTVGMQPDGEDFDAGWKFARETRTPVVDEHYYRPPQWFVDNQARYDAYERSGPHVYAGEYAAHDTNRRSTLRSALAEAAFMTGLERNGDVVRMASYAPLLARSGHTQWSPDLIYFTATGVFPTVNYYVQQLFASNAGDRYVEATSDAPGGDLAFSVVKRSASGELIVKLVNLADARQTVRLEMPGAPQPGGTATRSVLAGDPAAVNNVDAPASVVPIVSVVPVPDPLTLELPAHSLSVLRFAPRTPAGGP